MGRRVGSPKRFPIIRYKVAAVVHGLSNGSFKLIEYGDGHAEVLCLNAAVGFLTSKQVSSVKNLLGYFQHGAGI